jgi:CPA2 family monovalent cation:H+ antiporter-2/glutathione-regulated potassium-efflux system protein KefB
MLRQAGAAEAELICFCADGDQLTSDFLHSVHDAFPQASVFVRAFDRRAVINLRDAPIAYAVREVMESAVKMARLALDSVGVDEVAINKAEAQFRSRDRERLRAQLVDGDLRAARDVILTQDAREASTATAVVQ